MAIDAFIDSSQLNADLSSVADAIRLKSGGSSQLAFPSGFISEINSITTGSPLTLYAIRPDAELIKTYTSDSLLNADESITIPGYSTTATTIKASAALSETLTVDLTTYDYKIFERTLTYPLYNIATKAKGRVEYYIDSHVFDLSQIPSGIFKSILDSSKSAASTYIIPGAATYRSIYWSSGTKVAAYSTTAYSIVSAPVAPSFSNNVLTINTPTITMRGHTTYFTDTFFNAITDIRAQYVIQVYRAPKNNLNIDGWGMLQQLLHISECANSSSHTLT